MLTKLEHIQLVMEARCWKSLHRRTVSRLQQPPGATNSPTNSADETKSLSSAGFELLNVDSTIVAQAPKMAPHVPAMRERIAAALGLTPEAVNVKAKTAEKMGPVGEGRAIEARAVCLLVGLLVRNKAD